MQDIGMNDFNWADPLLPDEELTDDERIIRDAACAARQPQ